MPEWKNWSTRVTRLDIAPCTFITLENRDGDDEWSSSIDIHQDGLAYSATHRFSPSEYLSGDTAAAGADAVRAALGPKMVDYWTSHLVRLAAIADGAVRSVVTDKMAEINARFPSPAAGRLPEFHFYADYHILPADRTVTHGYRNAKRVMDEATCDLWTTQMGLLELAGDVLAEGRARVFVHDLGRDGLPYVHEIVLGGATPDGKVLRRAHNFYRLWRAGAFDPS